MKKIRNRKYTKTNFYPIDFLDNLGYLYDKGLSIQDIALQCDIPERICAGLLYYKTCSNPDACLKMRQEFLSKKYSSRGEFEKAWREKGFTPSFINLGVYGLNAYRHNKYKEFDFNIINKDDEKFQKLKKLNLKSKKFSDIEKRILSINKAKKALSYIEMEDIIMEKNFNINKTENTSTNKIMSFKNKVINAIALMTILNSDKKVEFPDFVSQEERDRAISFVRSKIKTESAEGKSVEISDFGYYFLSNISTLMDNLDRPSKSEYIGNLVSYIKAYQNNFNAFIDEVKAEVKRRERKDNNSIDECYKAFQSLFSSIYNTAKKDVINSLKREIDNEEEEMRNEILKLIEKLYGQKKMAEKEVSIMQKRIEELSSEEEKEENNE